MGLRERLEQIGLRQQASNDEKRRVLIEVFGLEDNMAESSDYAMKRSLMNRIRVCKTKLTAIPREEFSDFINTIKNTVKETIDDCYCPHCVCKGAKLLTSEDIKSVGADLTYRALHCIKEDLLIRNKMHLDMLDAGLKLAEYLMEEEEAKNAAKQSKCDSPIKENINKDNSDKNVLNEKKARHKSYDRALYIGMTKDELINELLKFKESKD